MKIVINADKTELNGGVHMAEDLKGFSGNYYVTGFDNEGDSATFTVEITEDKLYKITVLAAADPNFINKFTFIYVDGSRVGGFSASNCENFEPCEYPRLFLSKGLHKISIVRGWGNINVDALIIEEALPLPEEIYDIKPELVNPNADESAIRLMTYICNMYGKKILSGQQAGGGGDLEAEVIHRETGKYPALRGFDFIDYSPSRVAFGTKGSDTDSAIKWWKDGGIVTFAWHWNAPKDLINEMPDKAWYSGFYTYATTFDIEKAMNDKNSEEYTLILSDIDAISEQLKRLQAEGVPVLWRPLHEACGGWFWWGAKGPEPCKKLWKLLYDRLTNYHKLNNLIWVWNGQDIDWYPGDEYVDIIGEDIYIGKRAYASVGGKFISALQYTNQKKIIALTENGTIPDPDNIIQDGTIWSWFCTWCGTFVYKKNENGELEYCEDYTELSMLKKVYNHELVITKDDLPDLKNYPL